jgi:eukaryotic-like serine/threonine-protein kinase
MSARQQTGYERLPPAAAGRVDDACDRFESAWRKGSPPPIEVFLDEVPAAERPVLVRELILVEAPFRREAGQPPGPDEYQGRFPDLDATWLAQALLTPDDVPTQPSPAAAPPAPKVPGYEIRQELGRGGMGVVYLARHLKLDRLVALKMILTGPATSAAELTRFGLEAEAVASLQHPNIVQVFETGTADGHPYIAMEYVPGGSLAQATRTAPVSPRDAAKLVRTLAEGVQHAHERGIVHRDLKPANVLLAADGTPKIADFGLVKRLDDLATLTHTGAILGTPCYMAPEQAAGAGREVGPLSDVYALGAVLYELLTGRPPFQGQSPLEVLDRVRTEDPVPPRAVRLKVPRDLETICLTCLRKEPGKRYGRALAVAEDLGRFLASEPILARPVGPAERVALWARRHPTAAALSAALALAVAIGFPAVTWLWLRAAAALAGEKAARREADAELNAKRISLAHRAWLGDDMAEARRHLAETGEGFRTPEWHHLWQACHAERLVYREHLAPVIRAAYSPDGRHVATLDSAGEARVWDVATGRTAWTTGGVANLGSSLGYDPEGRVLVSAIAPLPPPGAQPELEVRVLEPTVGRVVRTFRRPASLAATNFSPDGRHLILGKNPLTVVNVSSGADAFIDPSGQQFRSVAWSPSGRHVAIAGADKATILALEFGATGVKTRTIVLSAPREIRETLLKTLALSPDGRRLAWATQEADDGPPRVRIWDLDAGRQCFTFLSTHSGPVVILAYSPDGRYIASASPDRTVAIWDVASGREMLTLRGHASAVSKLVFSPDGSRLVTAGLDRTVRVWDLTTRAEEE